MRRKRFAAQLSRRKTSRDFLRTGWGSCWGAVDGRSSYEEGGNEVVGGEHSDARCDDGADGSEADGTGAGEAGEVGMEAGVTGDRGAEETECEGFNEAFCDVARADGLMDGGPNSRAGTGSRTQPARYPP